VQRGASEHTCDSYAYAFQLLFEFASQQYQVAPSALQLEQIDAPLVLAFLSHLEAHRGNTASTRNARLAAIKSFMRFCEYRVPSILEQSRCILAIPQKRTDISLVSHLSMDEMHSILDAPDITTRLGLRDRAMIHLGFAAALRVSELVGLPLVALSLQPTPSVRVMGKGRRGALAALMETDG
jgi:site-specific recombinase XerD